MHPGAATPMHAWGSQTPMHPGATPLHVPATPSWDPTRCVSGQPPAGSVLDRLQDTPAVWPVRYDPAQTHFGHLRCVSIKARLACALGVVVRSWTTDEPRGNVPVLCRTPHRDSAWQVTPPTPAHVPPTARVDTPGTAHFPAGSPPQYTPGTAVGTPGATPAMYGTPADTPGMYSPAGAGGDHKLVV